VTPPVNAPVSPPVSPPPEWIAALADACAGLTPDALSRFAPPDDGSARASAVLMLLGEGPAGPDVLLIERAASLRDHAGQVAVPGGGVEPGDDGVVGTALREAQEETGLDPAGVAALGVLPTLFVPRSRFAVTPVLAWWHTPAAVGVQDPAEVAAVARVPLATLADPATRATVVVGGYRGPCFLLPELFVWGFTAGLLARLLDLGGFARPWDETREVPLPASVSGLAARGTV
jgi:8-oxo-dGTP pyrophosphatase MutT (NUDIX family)